MPKKTLIIAQILMTLMMAFCMSGIMYLVAVGPEQFQLSAWLLQFIIAWPIAFCLTQVVSRIAFLLAFMLSGARPDRH